MTDVIHMLIIESNFFDSCLEDIENNDSLSEAKIHEARRYFNRKIAHQKTTSNYGFSHDLESLPYPEFKTYDYLINHGYVSNPKLKEAKTSATWTNWFNDETTTTVFLVASMLVVLSMGFAIGSGMKTETCSTSSIEKVSNFKFEKN